MPIFGDLLRDLRRQRGIGLKTLAPELGVSNSHLSRLENNLVRPSDELVSRVAHYFDYSEAALLVSANRIPSDIMALLQQDPEQAVEFLRERFGSPRERPEEGESSTPGRSPADN